jgi:pyruvate formate lyase activating enzyme
MNNRAAMFWESTKNDAVQCTLCPHDCRISNNESGFCEIRKNKNGELIAMNYGKVSAIALDPIEKKPLYRFHPGKKVLSIGGFSCNLRCPFCQNHEIAMDGTSRQYEQLSPQDVLNLALQTVPEGNIGIAYTYNEPLIGYEFLYDCAKLINEAGLLNIVITNGYINEEPLEKLLPFIDAMNIDLKGFSDDFYKKVGGTLESVKRTIARAHNHCHIEVTTLIIPNENENDIESLAAWLASTDPEIPLHLSRFFPQHKYSDREPTTRETIYRLCETAKKHLKYVYAGNM